MTYSSFLVLEDTKLFVVAFVEEVAVVDVAVAVVEEQESIVDAVIQEVIVVAAGEFVEMA